MKRGSKVRKPILGQRVVIESRLATITKVQNGKGWKNHLVEWKFDDDPITYWASIRKWNDFKFKGVL